MKKRTKNQVEKERDERRRVMEKVGRGMAILSQHFKDVVIDERMNVLRFKVYLDERWHYAELSAAIGLFLLSDVAAEGSAHPCIKAGKVGKKVST